MDRILIILKKENGPRASSALSLGLNTIIFKHVYWYMQPISGERLQDHWSSGPRSVLASLCRIWSKTPKTDFVCRGTLHTDQCPLVVLLWAKLWTKLLLLQMSLSILQ